MTTLNEMINDLESELIKKIRNAGVGSINTGDIYETAPRLPAVNLLLIECEQSDEQVFQNGKVSWNISYEISCMFQGTERKQTFKNSRTFVNKIYDVVQECKNDNLNNTVNDLECGLIQYGKTNVNGIFIDGGKIELKINIIEVR